MYWTTGFIIGGAIVLVVALVLAVILLVARKIRRLGLEALSVAGEIEAATNSIWGIEGAATATVIIVLAYALLRYFIILKGFELQPYNNSMFRILILIVAGMCLHFLLPLTSNAIVNILYRSTIILGMYLSGTYFMNIIPEFHSFIPFLRKK